MVGASRGLGAATVEALARRGASVIGAYRQDHAAAAELRDALQESAGSVQLVPGDLTDPVDAAALLEEAGDGAQFLVCCASPSFQPLRVEPEHVDRILDHIDRAIRLVAVPLAAFPPTLARRSGRVVVISSSAVERPVPTWPQYVAAKSAIEGLVRVASLQYPDVRFLVKRPPALDTDLAVSPLQAERPLAPGPVRVVGIEIDPAAMTLHVEGKLVTTTATEFRLLDYFARHLGRVFTRDQLLDSPFARYALTITARSKT